MTYDKYFAFLCDIVGKKAKYQFLLRELYKIDFYAIVPNDENRGMDGLELREQFKEGEGLHALPFLDARPCSILEMMIALSQRLEFEVIQTPYEKSPKEWFWILIDNLGLSKMTDDVIREYPRVLDQVHVTISHLLSRTYSQNGDGGLFPLGTATRDQRHVEIWYQMTDYIVKNYSTF